MRCHTGISSGPFEGQDHLSFTFHTGNNTMTSGREKLTMVPTHHSVCKPSSWRSKLGLQKSYEIFLLLISRGKSFPTLGLEAIARVTPPWWLKRVDSGKTSFKSHFPFIGNGTHSVSSLQGTGDRKRFTICRVSLRFCLWHMIFARLPKTRSFSSTSVSLSHW